METTHIGAADWQKSSLSSVNGNCVEVATLHGGRVGVRDSKELSGPILVFSREEWTLFLNDIKGDDSRL